jgi:hypothetical protein
MKRTNPAPPFRAVGVGASAGGLAAFEEFLSGLPAEAQAATALAFVSHLDRDRRGLREAGIDPLQLVALPRSPSRGRRLGGPPDGVRRGLPPQARAVSPAFKI